MTNKLVILTGISVIFLTLIVTATITPLALARHQSDSSSSSSDNSGSSSSDNSGSNNNNNVGSSSQSGYSLTVNIGSHAFGNPSVNVEAKTANGNYDQTYSVNVQNPSVTFSIPAGSGPSVEVCVHNSGIVGAFGGNCKTLDATGSDMSVDMSP